ncbi:hypothetical protein [Adhaeribacter terreus]|uniref:TonB C-terminal domain-containing protein n=1 Tax=Adhaeribacter terreus TaxID=529703 RepID=A0ABW0EA37_9BACT
MKFIVLCIGLVICACNFSFGQQQGNLKILNHQQPSDSLYNVLEQTVEGTNRGGLNVSGWIFDRPPRPNDTSTESGKIIFEISVNKEGKIIACKALESSVSKNLMRLYRDAVVKSRLKPSTPGFKPEASATGTVTFIIKSQ